MKAFKKISLVYLLQIFAVILIFGYQRPSSATNEPLTGKVSTTDINKNPAGKPERNLLLTEKITDLPVIYLGKSW